MGLMLAFTGALGGTFADQWRDIIVPGKFGERTVVAPGTLKTDNRGRGSNFRASDGVISNGSKIFVPENTAAFVLAQGGIEEVVTQPGGYEYRNGAASILSGDGVSRSIFAQIGHRFSFGGEPDDLKQVAYVNLRELRGIAFGTQGPTIYHDKFYGVDLALISHGTFSVQVIDPTRFVRSYLPPNAISYSFDDQDARGQLMSEFLQAFLVALSELSSTYRINDLPAHSNDVVLAMAGSLRRSSDMEGRFGLRVVGVGIESIQLTPKSLEVVERYARSRTDMHVYQGISREVADVAAQQKIAEGIREHGLGNGGGMVLGMSLAGDLSGSSGSLASGSLEKQVAMVRKLKELLDSDALTQEEFDAKKREVLGL